MELRPLERERDLPRLAALHSLVEAEPVTPELLQEREKTWPEDGVRQEWVAVENGTVIGAGSVWRRPYYTPGVFWISTLVDTDRRGRGVGVALYEASEAFARTQGGTRLKVNLRDSDEKSVAFARRFGFVLEAHHFSSMLDLAAFDPEPFAGVVESVQASGICFFSFAETDRSEEAQRKLYAINTLAGRDVPDADPQEIRPFEQFVRDVYQAEWFRPEGQILAADGDLYVGLGAVGEIRPGVMSNMFTGVRREYRGRKIAQALKLLGLEFARKQGAKYIRTGNDSRNAPMLAINRKLGYQPEPGWYQFTKALDDV